MPLCLICLEREAIQTGSHLLSAFMIESVIGKRGHEKGYLLDDAPNFEYRQNTGADPIIEDFLFCRGCEQRMSYVEGYICSEYRDKIKVGRFKDNFSFEQINGNPGELCKARRVNTLAFTLLIISILFRMSVSKKKLFADFELRPHEQEHLRTILHTALPPYDNFKVKLKMPYYLRSLNNNADLFKGLFFIIATYDNLVDETMSFNLVHPEYRLPYTMMLGQLLVLFFFERPRKQARYLDFFGLFEYWDAVLPINTDQYPLQTIILPQRYWIDMLNKVRNLILEQKMPGIMQYFYHQHFQQHERSPDDNDWAIFLQENFPSE